VPAAFCGVYGIRPTHGRIDMTGAMPMAPSFDVPGWFASGPGIFRRVGEVLLEGAGVRAKPRQLIILDDAFAEADAEVASLLRAAIDMLTGGHTPAAWRRAGSAEGGLAGAYNVIAGLVGDAPLVTRSADYPFRQEFRLLDDPFTVRMDSWLPSDTFRRAGFGHVLRGREHVLILERGASLVSFDRNAQPSPPIYAASLYAPGERYRISSVSPSLAFSGPASGGPAIVGEDDSSDSPVSSPGNVRGDVARPQRADQARARGAREVSAAALSGHQGLLRRLRP